VAEKKENVLYSERMSQVKFSPSVRQFGGCGGEGVVVMTSTGIVCGIGIPREGGNRLITASESLATTRATLSIVDISYGKSKIFYIYLVYLYIILICFVRL
jgi:mediator of RNA polymerase II transcription subunit 16